MTFEDQTGTQLVRSLELLTNLRATVQRLQPVLDLATSIAADSIRAPSGTEVSLGRRHTGEGPV